MYGQILRIDAFSNQYLGLSLPLDQWRYQRLYDVVCRLCLCRVRYHLPLPLPSRGGQSLLPLDPLI